MIIMYHNNNNNREKKFTFKKQSCRCICINKFFLPSMKKAVQENRCSQNVGGKIPLRQDKSAEKRRLGKQTRFLSANNHED